MTFDPNAYGPRALAVVEELFRERMRTAEDPKGEMAHIMESMERATGLIDEIGNDADAIVFCLFIGFGAGKQDQGATVLPRLYEALAAGYEGAIHELARELEGFALGASRLSEATLAERHSHESDAELKRRRDCHDDEEPCPPCLKGKCDLHDGHDGSCLP